MYPTNTHLAIRTPVAPNEYILPRMTGGKVIEGDKKSAPSFSMVSRHHTKAYISVSTGAGGQEETVHVCQPTKRYQISNRSHNTRYLDVIITCDPSGQRDLTSRLSHSRLSHSHPNETYSYQVILLLLIHISSPSTQFIS